jgi:hypothetical protein
VISHLATIREMPCVLCEALGRQQQSPTEAHHVRIWEGAGQRAHDELAIPLCGNDCHRGPNGVHGDKALLAVAKVDEGDLLAFTLRKMLGRKAAPQKVFKRSSKILERNSDRPWPPRAA